MVHSFALRRNPSHMAARRSALYMTAAHGVAFGTEAIMDEDKKSRITPASSAMGHLLLKNPDAPPPANARKKRRRKGQLNDGQWAPGYGPEANRKQSEK